MDFEQLKTLLQDPVIYIFSALIGAVFSALVSLLLADKILFFFTPFFAQIFNLFRSPGVNITGIWEVVYPEVEDNLDDNQKHEIKHLLRIRQLGKHIVGKNIERGTRYFIRGKMYGNEYISGTWSDYSRSEHQGAFQLYIKANDKLDGKWIGFSTKNKGLIREGQWLWELRGDA